MTISELTLRLARPAEAPALANLSRDLIEYGLRWRWTAVRIAGSIRAPDVNVLVACVHGNIAGFAIMLIFQPLTRPLSSESAKSG